MQDLLNKRSLLESDLRSLEKQIFELETNYIEETQNTGNIIKGWDGFLTNKSSKVAQYTSVKKLKCNPNERLFSLSSNTSPAAKIVNEENDRNMPNAGGTATFQSRRNVKKRNYANYSEVYSKDSKKEEIYGYDDEDRIEGGYSKTSAKTPVDSKQKSDKKKLIKKTKSSKS